jgi:hypothetical protein
MMVARSAPRKRKTHPLLPNPEVSGSGHRNGFDFAHHERVRHPELQLLKGNSDLKPETKGRPPALLLFSIG